LLVGALETERDFLDIRDVCAAYIACIEKFDALENNMALNIATGQAVRIGDVLDRLLARAAVPITVAPDPARLRRSEIMRAAGDAGAARSLLGWRPRYHLDETIDSVLAAARDVLKRANSFVSDI
jgi:GDP-4-dehydro-6-deoxy-D-mannose reductase